MEDVTNPADAGGEELRNLALQDGGYEDRQPNEGGRDPDLQGPAEARPRQLGRAVAW